MTIKLIELNGIELDSWEYDYEIYQKLENSSLWVNVFSCHEAGGIGQTLAINQYTYLNGLDGNNEYRMYDKGTLI